MHQRNIQTCKSSFQVSISFSNMLFPVSPWCPLHLTGEWPLQLAPVPLTALNMAHWMPPPPSPPLISFRASLIPSRSQAWAILLQFSLHKGVPDSPMPLYWLWHQCGTLLWSPQEVSSTWPWSCDAHHWPPPSPPWSKPTTSRSDWRIPFGLGICLP